MATYYLKRYIWLVEYLLRNDGAKFKDIQEEWAYVDDLNPKGEPLSRSSFNKQIMALKDRFKIAIIRSKIDGKYRVDNYHGQLDNVLLNNISLFVLLDREEKLEGRILFEKDPVVNYTWLERIARAMSDGNRISLDYKSYKDERTTSRPLNPYCLKLHKRRWYLLAKDGPYLKTFALDDRIKGVQVLQETFIFPEDFNANEYFLSAFGIRPGKPEQIKDVVIKTFGMESYYWRSAPFHHSQQEIETGKDYAVFHFHLNAEDPEIIHSLLSHGATIEVLEPESLRETIKTKIVEMMQLYA